MNIGAKSIVLEAWFGVDQVLLNAPAGKVLHGDIYENYLTAKATFLHNLYEICAKIKFNPDVNFNNVSQLAESGIQKAISAKETAKEILRDTDASELVAREIREMGATEKLSEEQVAKYVVRKRLNTVALDCLVMESIIGDNNDAKKFLREEFIGKVLFEAYKVTRDNLIHISFM